MESNQVQGSQIQGREQPSVGRTRRGFTLVELLVVIAIIGILVALLLPAVQSAREAARRMQCSNNCKQIGLAIHNYHDTYKALPMAWYLDITPRPFNGESWAMSILPFLEQQPLYDRYDHSVLAADQLSPANVAVIQTPLSVFVCPSAPGGVNRAYTFDANPANLPFTATDVAPSDYIATTGVLGAFANIAYNGNAGGSRGGALKVIGPFGGNQGSRLADIIDGTTNTFLIGERTGGNQVWTKSEVHTQATAALIGLEGGGWGDLLNGEHWLGGTLQSGLPWPPQDGPCAINCTSARGYGFHSFHPGGAQFVMGDASVQFMSTTVDPLAIAGRITTQKGEILPD